MPTRAQMSEAAEHEGGHTELMRAALEGRTETVKRLLESGADVNERDDEGRTALMFAVTNIHNDSARALLDHGADVNVTAKDGSTALMLGASAGDIESVRDLLSKGADVSAKFTQTGKTALMLAKEKTSTDIIQLLEAAEQNINE
jgi:ankyrin repeat protein